MKPNRPCHLATAVATILWDRQYKGWVGGEAKDLSTPGEFEGRGLVETPDDVVWGGRRVKRMMGSEADFDLYVTRDFFDAEECAELLGEMRRARVGAAPVYGRGESGDVDERVRKAALLAPSGEAVERVVRRLSERREEVGSHFGLRLGACEEPQFLRYGVGDFFVAHQDGNTGMLMSERERSRKISVVVFLNRQSESPEEGAYCGGALVFSDWRKGRRELPFFGEAGTLVAFRAETTHEVLPVTHGERYSIVSWYG